MTVDVRLVDVGADDESVFAFGKKRRASSTPKRLASSGVISPGTKDCRRW